MQAIKTIILSFLLACSWLTCHARSQAEMEASYRQSGLEDYLITLFINIVPIGKELHDKARFESNLSFKTLRIGAEFPIKSEKSAAGFTVKHWRFADTPSRDIEVQAGSEDAFECWSQDGNLTVICFLVDGEKLAMAFGQKLQTTGVILSRPAAGFDPVSDPAYMGMAPIVLGIVLAGTGEELAKTALAYFSDMYGKRPTIRTADNKQTGIGPSDEECARVNAKKLSALTTNDLGIRKACAAPINDLLSFAQSKKTSYTFESSKGLTEVVVQRNVTYGNVHVIVKLLHPKLSDYNKRVKDKAIAAANAFLKRKAAEKQKDF